MNYKDVLLDFYKRNDPNNLEKSPHWEFCDPNQGPDAPKHVNAGMDKLGDKAAMTHIWQSAHASSKEVYVEVSGRVMRHYLKFNDYYIRPEVELPVGAYQRFDTGIVPAEKDWGGGHCMQSCEKLLGLKTSLIPRPYLNVKAQALPRVKNKVGICTTTANDVPARNLTPENFNLLQEFINESSNEYSFCEFGGQATLENVEDFCGLSIGDSIIRMSELDFFIALNSGFMHLATVLKLKTIAIVGEPDVSFFYVPQLALIHGNLSRDLTWFFPQNVHLHQRGENPLVPAFSKENLKKALGGDVYPTWDNRYGFCEVLPEYEKAKGLIYNFYDNMTY